MKVVFADTYYYLARASLRDTGHEGRAATFSRGYHGGVLTTFLGSARKWADALASPDQRRLFVAILADLKRDPHTTIVPPTQLLFGAGCDLYSDARTRTGA